VHADAVTTSTLRVILGAFAEVLAAEAGEVRVATRAWSLPQFFSFLCSGILPPEELPSQMLADAKALNVGQPFFSNILPSEVVSAINCVHELTHSVIERPIWDVGTTVVSHRATFSSNLHPSFTQRRPKITFVCRFGHTCPHVAGFLASFGPFLAHRGAHCGFSGISWGRTHPRIESAAQTQHHLCFPRESFT